MTDKSGENLELSVTKNQELAAAVVNRTDQERKTLTLN